MIIRNATIKDVSIIAGFQQRMAGETENLSLDEIILIKGVTKLFQDPSKGFYLVAIEDDAIVASMLLTPEWSDWRNSLYLWIQSLYVLPEYRRKGVFRKMYEHVKQIVLDSEAYAGLKLYVDQNNVSAQEVYKQVGMEASHYNLFEWSKFDH